MTGAIRSAAAERFWDDVDKTGDCWNWTKYVDPNGYGHCGARKPFRPTSSQTKLTHRIAYELAVGPIPEGMHLDHLCRNRACCNPAHLEPVLPKENTARGLHGVLRTHCNYGHELTPENTLFDAPRNCRRCKKCNQESMRRSALRNRVGNETYMRSRRKPCQRCGGPKGPGRRRKLCDICKAVNE